MLRTVLIVTYLALVVITTSLSIYEIKSSHILERARQRRLRRIVMIASCMLIGMSLLIAVTTSIGGN